MSWQKLNNHELQACRKLLMLDVAEAAECFGNCSPRAWQHWESGARQVPHDIDEAIYAAISIRNELIEALSEELSDEENKLRYFHTFDDFLQVFPGESKAIWRIYQSAVSYLFCDGEEVELTNEAEISKDSYVYKRITKTRDEDIEYARLSEKLGI